MIIKKRVNIICPYSNSEKKTINPQASPFLYSIVQHYFHIIQFEVLLLTWICYMELSDKEKFRTRILKYIMIRMNQTGVHQLCSLFPVKSWGWQNVSLISSLRSRSERKFISSLMFRLLATREGDTGVRRLMLLERWGDQRRISLQKCLMWMTDLQLITKSLAQDSINLFSLF